MFLNYIYNEAETRLGFEKALHQRGRKEGQIFPWRVLEDATRGIAVYFDVCATEIKYRTRGTCIAQKVVKQWPNMNNENLNI